MGGVPIMRSFHATLMILFTLVFVSVACSKEATLPEPITYYAYDGIVVSLVNKHDNSNEMNGHETLYYLGLSDFHPDEQIFAEYLSMYSEPGYRHLRMTDETEIYEQRENRKITVDLSALETGTSVQVWIYYLAEDPQRVFVKEIIIMT